MVQVEGGYQIHDWLEHQGPLIEKRRKDRERKKRHSAGIPALPIPIPATTTTMPDGAECAVLPSPPPSTPPPSTSQTIQQVFTDLERSKRPSNGSPDPQIDILYRMIRESGIRGIPGYQAAEREIRTLLYTIHVPLGRIQESLARASNVGWFDWLKTVSSTVPPRV